MDGYKYRILVDTNGNAILPTLMANANRADKSMNRLAAGSRNAASGVASLGDSSKGAGMGLKSLSKIAVSLGITFGAGMLAKSIIQTGAAFEKSMSNVAAISSATDEEFTRLKKAARDAGAATVFSASESADAMGFLAMAGFKANQQIAALPGTLNLAAAGSLDLAKAADITVNTLAQFGMAAEQSNIVADQLAFTANNFNTNVEMIAESMKYFGPTAKAFGISLEESNAVIGLLANSGLKGSMATRALSTSFSRLSNPTKQITEAMKSINLSVFDAQGNFVGLTEMIRRMEKATAGLTQQQRQAAIATIFGSENLQEINILMDAGADKIAYWTEQLSNAEGTAQRVADVKLDNLAGDFKILESTAQEFTLSLYDELQPTLRSITQQAIGFIKSLDVSSIAASLGSFAKGLANVAGFLMKNWSLIVGLGKAYIVLKVATIGYTIAAKAAALTTSLIAGAGSIKAFFSLARSIKSSADAMALLSLVTKANPVGLIVGGIAALGTAFALFGKKKKDVKEATLSVSDAKKTFNDFYTQERSQLDLIFSKLKKTNEKSKERNQLVDELKSMYPELNSQMETELRNTNNLSDAYSTLSENVRQRAQLKSKEKILESFYDQMQPFDDLVDAQLDGYTKNNKGEIKYIQYSIKDDGSLDEIDEWVSQAVARKRITDRLLSGDITHIPGATIGQNVISDYKKAKSDAERLLSQIADLSKSTQSTLVNGGNGAIPGANGLDENIIKGGSSQKIINITVSKFQDTVTNIFGGDTEENRRKAEDFMAYINEGFFRILNSANQIA